jgi:hypothetical protein
LDSFASYKLLFITINFMKRLKWFLWLCSGAHIKLLDKCPSEASKYTGIGATVFFTGVFAAIASSYAMYTVFDSVWASIAFGSIWGLMIFNLDRYIVSSMRKEGKFSKELITALPRIILAVLISLVIAKPLEMKIFEKEIRSQLSIMEQEIHAEQELSINARLVPARQRLMEEIGALKKEIEVKTERRDDLRRLAQEEADGTGGSMRRNAGPIYKIKKADADQVEEELQQLLLKNGAIIQTKEAQIADLDSTMQTEMSNLEQADLDGPAARMEALSRLTDQSNAIWLANWFIILLFIAVETAPVFVKLISPQGPYDHLLKVVEHGFEGKRVEILAQNNARIKQNNKELPEPEVSFIRERLDTGLQKS